MTYEIASATKGIILDLYGNGNLNKAVLADFQNSRDITSLRARGTWPVIMSHLNQKYLSPTGKTTKSETAIFAAVRLFAIQQRGEDQLVYAASYPRDQAEGVTIFDVLADMRKNPDDRTRIDGRGKPLLETTNINTVINSLNHLVSMIKGTKRKVKIDYAQLAQELFWFQVSFEQASQVQMAWGQKYFKAIPQKANSEGTNK